MSARKRLLIAGKQYASLHDAARAHGVPVTQLSRRLRAGWPPEEAAGAVPHKRLPRRSARVEVRGEEYSSIRALAKSLGLNEGTLAARLRAGHSLDTAAIAAPLPRPKKKGNAIAFRGEQYQSWKALATRYGVSDRLFRKRFVSGWSVEQSLGLSDPPPRFRDYSGHARDHRWKQVQVADGKEFPVADPGSYKLYVIRNKRNGKEYVGITISALEHRFNGHVANAKRGVRSKLYNAIRHYGRAAFVIELIRSDATDFAELQQQEVAEIAARGTLTRGYNVAKGGSIGTTKELVVDGRRFASWGEAATHFGIDQRVFAMRLSRLKWSPEQAAELVPRPRYGRFRLVLEGRQFSTLKEAATHYGKNYALVHDRIRGKGWTVEEALELVPRRGRR